MDRGLKLVLLALLGVPGFASAQRPPRQPSTRYGFSLGVALYQARDEVLNPVRHSGPSISAGVFRESVSDIALNRVRLSFAFAPLTDRYSPDRSSVLFHPAIEVRYARRAVQVSENVGLYVGGTAGWNTRLSVYENWDQGHVYWLTSSHLGVATSLVGQLDHGHSVRMDFDAPLLAVVSRPPERFEYKEVKPNLGWVIREIHGNPRITSIHEHTAVTATLSYLRPDGGLFGQRLFWQMAFVSNRLAGSRPFTSLSHTVGISHGF